MTRPLPPAEWAPHKAVWIGFPSHPELWEADLEPAQEEVAAFARAVHAGGRGERVLLVAANDAAAAAAERLAGDVASVVVEPFGDIWLRDTGPIFARTHLGPVALRFATNSWGGKYDLPDDATVGDDIARLAETPVRRFDFVLEGGAVDHDGEGTILTTRQTLLNPNRNGWSKKAAEAALGEAFGAKKIIWIDEGLKNDHTDGHIDNIARFAGPGRVVCQAPAGDDDPNGETLDAIARMLESATDASGRKLEVARIPGVGLYRNALGDVAPASHMNFVIANGLVVVPVYGTPTEAAALAGLQLVFPNHKVVGIPSRGLLGCGTAGGGSFHCITQQEPL